MALRSGATREPSPNTRWQDAHAPLPANSPWPRASSPRVTALRSKSRIVRRYDTSPVSSEDVNSLGGIAVPGMPARSSPISSTSEPARL